MLITLASLLLSQGLFAGIVSTSPAKLSANTLELALSERLMRVEEFRFIRSEAERRGIRVWLFGGTAAGYAHYVNWDLLREAGDQRIQDFRFDYDFTNIYRSTQDLDIVVDGPPEVAEKLETALQEKFPHLQGSRSAWEVRLLKQSSRGKEALFNNRDFLEQHTDSNSTGMIEITNPPKGDVALKDFRDWKARRPFFFEDVLAGRLHYYYSETHHQTARALKNLNPPILSAIRFLTKAFQYEVDVLPKDMEIITRIINDWNPKAPLDSYVQSWIEKNAKKLFQNATNIEYAWNTIDQLGLRQKLIAINGNVNSVESLGWWMSKEPLRALKLGQFETNDHRHTLMPNLKPWKTAKELGIDTVSHETRSFLAYESITRSHLGSPNVLISRQNFPGEAAMHGNGFYTRRGRSGAAGTNITIRFKVKPDAREGVDFTTAGDYVIVLNKNALEVIPESIQMTPYQYFKTLQEGSGISSNDLGILEKFKRKVRNHSKTISLEETEKIRHLMDDGGFENPAMVREYLELFPHLLSEPQAKEILKHNWRDVNTKILSLPQVQINPLEYLSLLHIGIDLVTEGTEYEDLKKRLRQKTSEVSREKVKKFSESIQIDAITHTNFDFISEFIDLFPESLTEHQVETILQSNSSTLILKLISIPKWLKFIHQKGQLKQILPYWSISIEPLSNALFNFESQWLESTSMIGDLLINLASIDPHWADFVARDVLSRPPWARHYSAYSVLESVIRYCSQDGLEIVRDHLLKTEPLRGFHPSLQDALFGKGVNLYLMGDGPPVDSTLLHSDLGISALMKVIQDQTHSYFQNAIRGMDTRIAMILSDSFFAQHEKGPKLLLAFIAKERNWDSALGDSLTGIISKILSKPHWYSHPQAEDIFDAIIERYESNPSRRFYGREQGEILLDIFSHPNWAQSTRGIEFVSRVLNVAPLASHAVVSILPKPEWATQSRSIALLQQVAAIRFSFNDGSQMMVAQSLSESIFTMPEWTKRPEVLPLVEDCIASSIKFSQSFKNYFPFNTHAFLPTLNILSSKIWIDHPLWPHLVRKAMEFRDGNYLMARHLFSLPEVSQHPESGDLLLQLIHNARADGDIVNSVLTQQAWADHPRAMEFIEELQKLGTVNDGIQRLLKGSPLWSKNRCAQSLGSQ